MPASLNRRIKSLGVNCTDQKITSLNDCQGQWLVLYFYPKDNTSGCSMQADDFSAALPTLQQHGAAVLGVSRDSMKSHQSFIEKRDIAFPLISDPDETLCAYFDVMTMKSMYGRQYLGVERSTFLIDPSGKLVHAWRKVKVKGHVDEVIATLTEYAEQ